MVKLQAHVLEARRNHLKRGIGKDGKWVGASACGMLGASQTDTGKRLGTPDSLSLPQLTLGLYLPQRSVPGEVYSVILQTGQRPTRQDVPAHVTGKGGREECEAVEVGDGGTETENRQVWPRWGAHWRRGSLRTEKALGGGTEGWVQRRGAGRGQGTCRDPYLPGVELAVLKAAFHGTQGYCAHALLGRSQPLLPLAASLLKALPPTSAITAA